MTKYSDSEKQARELLSEAACNLAYASGAIYSNDKDLSFRIMQEVKRYEEFLDAKPIDERWRPGKFGLYFYISACGEVVQEKNCGEFDEKCFNFGNCFQFIGQAEKAAQLIKETLIKFHKENQ